MDKTATKDARYSYKEFQERCYECMRVLWAEHDDPEALKTLELLIKIVRNVVVHPGIVKYRKLRRANRSVERGVFKVAGARQLLQVCGFKYTREPEPEDAAYARAEGGDDRILMLEGYDSDERHSWFIGNRIRKDCFTTRPADMKPIKFRIGTKMNSPTAEAIAVFRPTESVSAIYRFVQRFLGITVDFGVFTIPKNELVPFSEDKIGALLGSRLHVERVSPELSMLPPILGNSQDDVEREETKLRALRIAKEKEMEKAARKEERYNALREFKHDRMSQELKRTRQTNARLRAQELQQTQQVEREAAHNQRQQRLAAGDVVDLLEN